MDLNQKLIEEAKQFLKNNNVASLATISHALAKPEAAIIFYYYDNRNALYFTTLSNSRKIKNISINNNVALTICNAENKQELQIEGNASIIDNPDDTILLIGFIYKAIKNDSNWPILKLHPKDLTVVRIVIKWFKYSNFTENNSVLEGNFADWI